MKGLSLFSVLCFSCCAFAGSAREPIVDIYKADVAKVSGKIVRYFQTFDSPCVNIQILKPGGQGAASDSIAFCGIAGKSFNNGFSDVSLDKATFSDTELQLTFKLMSLVGVNETTELCKFRVDGERLAEPECTAQ
ncbi:hypothetical protein EJA70_31655 [Pseudomonas sp. PB103]|uniref:hypothetical protein n=1 Tax=Pseudomonas sp. PB103 TaxID=2494698 RepID=UPI00131B864D|nr:hypothetical protein [Pseudomonas sp. PB103]KAE9638370.1 hypothetical protein EJA70_31655 [Pseudomonas sp. PB103]